MVLCGWESGCGFVLNEECSGGFFGKSGMWLVVEVDVEFWKRENLDRRRSSD